jgi:small redox-active disulfide protein 2
MTVKILGGGCAACKKLEKLTLKAMKKMSVDFPIEKVTDFQEIMNTYNVMTTPALVLDEEVVIKGRVPSLKEVQDALGQHIG